MNVYQRTASVATFALVLVLGVAACGKKAPAVSPPPPIPPTAPATPPAPPAPPAPPPSAPAPRALTEDEIFAQKTADQLNREGVLADVFFDLDASTIRTEGRAALTANANYLKRWTSVRFNIEGHCDERGTAEYNLALGERRALAAKNYLISLGIGSDKIKTVSYGKEFPFDPGHDDGAWQKNRRAHFVITAK
jgi:peptidoglycan-associated lipoprotein